MNGTLLDFMVLLMPICTNAKLTYEIRLLLIFGFALLSTIIPGLTSCIILCLVEKVFSACTIPDIDLCIIMHGYLLYGRPWHVLWARYLISCIYFSIIPMCSFCTYVSNLSIVIFSFIWSQSNALSACHLVIINLRLMYLFLTILITFIISFNCLNFKACTNHYLMSSFFVWNNILLLTKKISIKMCMYLN